MLRISKAEISQRQSRTYWISISDLLVISFILPFHVKIWWFIWIFEWILFFMIYGEIEMRLFSMNIFCVPRGDSYFWYFCAYFVRMVDFNSSAETLVVIQILNKTQLYSSFLQLVKHLKGKMYTSFKLRRFWRHWS